MFNTGDTQLFTLDQVHSRRFISVTEDEHDEDRFTCKKGWIVTIDEDGNYTPYFVYTRSQDIVWDQKHIKDIIRGMYGDNHLDVVEMKSYVPGVVEKFKFKKWDVSVDLGKRTYDFRRKISVAQLFDMDTDQTDMFYTFELPIRLINDSDFFISHTMSGRNEQLATASVNIYTEDEILEDYTMVASKITIHLRNLIYYFHPNFKNMSEYKNSYLYLTVSGRTVDV